MKNIIESTFDIGSQEEEQGHDLDIRAFVFAPHKNDPFQTH